jgi:hypothetical protein
VGVALWIAAGAAAWVVARIVPFGRPAAVEEAVAALLASALAGVAATALDFGGWAEPDWRTALFAFFCAAALIGVMRIRSEASSAAAPR